MKLLLAGPRGFCAGVDRAIEVVTTALEWLGRPLYVRREIVHNRHVIDTLTRLGAVFVADVEDVPPGSTLVLSAHGVAPEVYENARMRGMNVIDATCPLVTKVHVEALRFVREGRTVIIVGHREHDEVIGTLGYTGSKGRVVASIEDAERVEIPSGPPPAVLTQTTLSVRDTRAILDVLRERFPGLVTPDRDDICYATQNRQNAVLEISKRAQLVIVLGSKSSSNSNRLREVAESAGVRAYLIDDVSQFEPAWLDGIDCAGVTSGASTPEHVVFELVDFLRNHYGAEVEPVIVARENTAFAPPAGLCSRPREEKAKSRASVTTD